MSESIEVSEAKRRFPIQLPYNRDFETRAREQDAFIAGWRAALSSGDAAKRAEWEAEQGETLRQVEKFLADAEEVGRITDPAEQFGTLTEKAAGVVDRAWRQGLRRILGPVPDTGAEDEFAPGECDGSGTCTAPIHIHGCFTPHRSDQCDSPDEYGHIDTGAES